MSVVEVCGLLEAFWNGDIRGPGENGDCIASICDTDDPNGPELLAIRGMMVCVVPREQTAPEGVTREPPPRGKPNLRVIPGE